MPIILEDSFISTNDVRLHTVQAGPLDGPLVVLLHGFPEFWRGWIHQIEPLAQAGLRVVVPDQRGYNLSDKPGSVSAYAVAELARDVLGLLDALDRPTCRLAGHDWGAAVAWETALAAPQRVEQLAILNVPHPDVMARTLLSSPKQFLKSWYIYFFQIPCLPEWLLGLNGCAGLRRMMRASRGRAGSFSTAELDEYAAAWSRSGALPAMLAWYRAAFRGALRGPRSVMRRLRVPTLMLWGAKDVALSRDMARSSIDLCDDGRLVFYEDASHWLQHDRPAEVSAELVKFFS